MCVDENGIGSSASVIPWVYITAIGAATAMALVLFKLASPASKNGAPMPPGPPATWSWENAMPKKHIAHELTVLVEQYGPVVALRRGNNVTIIIGRMDAATEIMEKEGATLVDRPHLISAKQFVSGGMHLVLEPAGDRFRRQRRTAHTHLQLKAAETYEEIQAETAKDIVLDILDDPKRYKQHAQRYAMAVALHVTYGKTSPTRSYDPEMARIWQVVENFETAMLRPGAYLVDRIPWLKYVPGYGRQLREFHRLELALFRDLLNRVRNDIATNSASPSFGKMLLEHTDDHGLSDDETVYLAGTLLGAASGTTTSSIILMIMAAVCHPDAQLRVQEELDEVVGRDRAPTFGDWDMLPQLNAFMLEALRWRPVTPLGLPHRATKDIVWRGQCIPAGATVIGCHWSISRDPEVFPDPETFNPGRWLTEDGHLRTDMHFYTYGFGRRVCPGQHVANRSIYITLALLLWAFRILQRPDAPIHLGRGSFQDVGVFHPDPFEVDFKPRIEERRLRELMAH